MSRSRPKFLVLSDKYGPNALERLRAVGDVEIACDVNDSSLERIVRDYDAILVRTCTQVTRSVIESARRLKVIGRGGVGLDNIDINACRARGVVVVHTPGAATDAVADLTIALIVNVLRGILQGDRAARRGGFEQSRKSLIGKELGGLSIGIVGLGRIGKAVARRCRLGFGMRVVYADLVEMGPLDFASQQVSIETLVAESDVVSLHVPLDSSTHGMIGADALSSCKSDAILINTSRGGVVDTAALVGALASGRLGGAGLDVTDPEPLPEDHPLWRFPDVVITPHIGAGTVEAQRRMDDVVEDVIRVVRGQTPRFSA